MEKQGTGRIHIYCGNGKGKTTTGMGLSIRAAGYGYNVLIYQFMKNNSTSERNSLRKLDHIRVIDGREMVKFSFQLSEEEKKELKEFYENEFRRVTKIAADENFDVLFFDELIYTIGAGLFDEQILLDFLKTKPEKLEIILTGQNPSQALIDAADYVSEIRKIKHPFDEGLASRKGIER